LSDGYQLRGVRIGAVIVVALVAAFLVWFFVIRDSGNDNNGGNASAPAPNVVGPVAATPSDLVDLSKKLDQPIYWAGDQPGTTDLELTQTAEGNVYVRYLTGNAAIGVDKPDYLTVGTYPFKNAYNALQQIGKQPGSITKDVANGGLGVQSLNSPTNAYLAYPDEDFQVEVFDPNSNQTLDLITAGDITTVP
jgi:hypothetical protein